MREKTDKRKVRTIIIVIALALIGGAAYGFLVGKFTYERGLRVGRDLEHSEVVENIHILADAVSGKTEFRIKLEELFDDIPGTFTSGNVSEYKTKLEELRDSVDDEDVKAKVQELVDKAGEFEEAFESQDNSEIETKLGEMKELAKKNSVEIQKIFDSKIRQSTQGLRLY